VNAWIDHDENPDDYNLTISCCLLAAGFEGYRPEMLKSRNYD
jgi:hypothetical protein